ncbi:YceD family protein [Aquipuribacter sp. MA13-6]|uniref:YceD family protein n=1 Tax=unclassified Aquipuribacter TaxID=2635084 RepID=UPI003EEAEB6F
MLRVQRTVPAPVDLGNGVIAVTPESPMELDLRLEAVMEGVLVSGTVSATATGECVRCLDPVTEAVGVDVQELFLHEPPAEGEDDAELPLLDGDLLDLEPAVRDAVVPSLPFQPVCDPDCPGLCSRCGARLLDDPDHSHEESDPRWSVLQALTLPDQNDGTATPADPDRTQEETN